MPRFSAEFEQHDLELKQENALRYGQRLIELAEHEYTQRNLLGRGQSAEVWFGTAPEFKKDICFKTVTTSEFEVNSLAQQFSLHDRFQQAGIRVPRLIAHASGMDSAIFGPEGFLAMEKVAGRTLEEEMTYRQKKGLTFSRDEMMHIIRDASGLIERAHDQRLYHRDLTLNNVMLTPEGNVVLIDFGKAYEATGDEDASSVYLENVIRDGKRQQIRYTTDDGFIPHFSLEVKKRGLLA